MELQLQEIITKIEALHPDKSWTYDVDIVLFMERIIKIVKGESQWDH